MTSPPVDLDDFKAAWQRLDARLAAQHALAFQAFRDRRLQTMRRRLWPLYGGQVVQLLFGIAMVAFGAYGWRRNSDVPHLVAAGLLVQAYGVAAVATAGRTMQHLREFDYGVPVVALQRQLAALRAWHVRTGVWLGQAWWFLWMPCVMIVAAALGVDVWRRAPRVLALGLAVGIVGVIVMEAAARLSRRPRWTWLAVLNDDAMAGASLRRAEVVLDEIAQFEDETTAPDA